MLVIFSDSAGALWASCTEEGREAANERRARVGERGRARNLARLGDAETRAEYARTYGGRESIHSAD